MQVMENAQRLSADPALQPEASSSGRELTSVPVPDIMHSIPSICENVLLGNLRCQSFCHLRKSEGCDALIS